MRISDWSSDVCSSDLEADVVRGNILRGGKRIDGRTTKDIRPIVAQVGVLPLTHGSALFTRGETQALVTTTLGTGQDEQIIDSLEGRSEEHTSELQSLMRISYAVFCLKKKNQQNTMKTPTQTNP